MANEHQMQLGTRFIVTGNERETKETVRNYVKAQDTVLDVGCKDGALTSLIAAICKQVIGIDHTEDAIKMARKLYPELRFELVDGFDASTVQGLGNMTYDAIFINMPQLAGYSSLLDTICLLNMYASVFKPPVVVVRNKNLKSLVARCSAWDPSLKGLEAAKELQRSKSTKFIGTRGVEEFRASIDTWVSDLDNVLEIGCEWGTTTELIAPKAKYVIGTDISLKCIERARQMRPNIKFEVLDGFNAIDALNFGTRFEKVYIDISGLSGYRSLLDVISLLKSYEMILKPRAIIIKSGALKHFASHFVAWEPVDTVTASKIIDRSE